MSKVGVVLGSGSGERPDITDLPLFDVAFPGIGEMTLKQAITVVRETMEKVYFTRGAG